MITLEELMKRAAFVILIAVSAGSVIGAFGIGVPKVKATIPFAFFVGNDLVPAGDYIFEMRAANFGAATGSCFVLRNDTGKILQLVAAVPGDTARGGACVVFNRYGDKHFLHNVQAAGFGATVGKSRAEKEISLAYAKSQGAPETVRVGAGAE